MGETLFKKVDYTLMKLIDQIEMGTLGLPDIQRPFVWPDAKVRDLFDSMYRGYPVRYFCSGKMVLNPVTSRLVRTISRRLLLC